MTNVTKHQQRPDRIERIQPLQAGQYWRSTCDIWDEGIEAGTVLLIQSIRWVDNAAHTVVLRSHPSKFGRREEIDIPDGEGGTNTRLVHFDEHRFLLSDFLKLFEHEPDYQRVRNEEINAVHRQIGSLQQELLATQADPSAFTDIAREAIEASRESGEGISPAQAQEALASPPATIGDAIGTGITAERVESMKRAVAYERDIAAAKSDWIQGKTAAIGEAVRALTPFYEEQAAAALAQTEDVRTFVDELLEGIASLDLYVGKNVTVSTLREGASAPASQPLTFVQRKLFVDEELAVYTDLHEWFDFSKLDLFFNALREHDALVDQIFPTQRCILVMATTRRAIDYGDVWTNAALNERNHKVFLMVRDGGNIYQVCSPVESHLGASRLFPSRDELDRPFSGVDGSQISFQDVRYTDSLKVHEVSALHYKRFLILVCGLDHRLKLFGDFYDGPASLDFVSQGFQDAHCRFLHDDDGEGMLPGASKPDVFAWLEEKNRFLRSGSRLLCDWSDVITPETAPAVFTRAPWRTGGYERQYGTAESTSVAVVAERKGRLIAPVPVSGVTNNGATRRFTCHVDITEYLQRHFTGNQLTCLCLDAVSPEEVRHYIQHRPSRADHVNYIAFFKRALAHLEAEAAEEFETRNRLAQALEDGGIATGDAVQRIIQQAVIAWRAANRGASLPRFTGTSSPAGWTDLLNQLYMLARTSSDTTEQVEQIEQWCAGVGYLPLRLILTAKGDLSVYAAPSEQERDDRLTPHAWTHCIRFKQTLDGLKEHSRRWATLCEVKASETTLHEWEGAADWINIKQPFKSLKEKQRAFSVLGQGFDDVEVFKGTLQPNVFETHFERWQAARASAMRNSNYVVSPSLFAPIGLIHNTKSGSLWVLGVGTTNPECLLYRSAPDDEARNRLEREFLRAFARPQSHLDHFSDEDQGAPTFSLLTQLLEGSTQIEVGYCARKQATLRLRDEHDPRLDVWFQHWHDSEGANTQVWLHPQFRSESNSLAVDDKLGIALPPDFNPVNVHHFIVNGKPDIEWFDIAPLDMERAALVKNLRSWGSSGYSFATLTQARAWVARNGGVSLADGDQSGLPDDLLPPPAGVERWLCNTRRARSSEVG